MYNIIQSLTIYFFIWILPVTRWPLSSQAEVSYAETAVLGYEKVPC
jgi:hypothetical protein